jgi:hypothetical protein
MKNRRKNTTKNVELVVCILENRYRYVRYGTPPPPHMPVVENMQKGTRNGENVKENRKTKDEVKTEDKWVKYR